MSDDRRLIEDFLPIQATSAEASREKPRRLQSGCELDRSKRDKAETIPHEIPAKVIGSETMR